jgi:tRNA G46 methylase TrmB
MHRVLTPGGELWVKTDDEPYFRWMEKVFAQAKGFERFDWPVPNEMPQTDFERVFVAKGLPIYSTRLRKTPQ